MAIYDIRMALALEINSLTDSFYSLPLAKYSIALGLLASSKAKECSDFEPIDHVSD